MNELSFFLYFSKYFSKDKIVFGIPNESKYTILCFEDDIAIKWEPFSFSFDKLTITEKLSSSNVGILAIENVHRNELLILFIK